MGRCFLYSDGISIWHLLRSRVRKDLKECPFQCKSWNSLFGLTDDACMQSDCEEIDRDMLHSWVEALRQVTSFLSSNPYPPSPLPPSPPTCLLMQANTLPTYNRDCNECHVGNTSLRTMRRHRRKAHNVSTGRWHWGSETAPLAWYQIPHKA